MQRSAIRIVFVTVLAVLTAPGQNPKTPDQHAQDVAELQALQQQILSGTDPCAVLPKLKAVMTRIANESPENYAAMKPSLDMLNENKDCPASPASVPPPPPTPPPPAPKP